MVTSEIEKLFGSSLARLKLGQLMQLLRIRLTLPCSDRNNLNLTLRPVQVSGVMKDFLKKYGLIPAEVINEIPTTSL